MSLEFPEALADPVVDVPIGQYHIDLRKCDVRGNPEELIVRLGLPTKENPSWEQIWPVSSSVGLISSCLGSPDAYPPNYGWIIGLQVLSVTSHPLFYANYYPGGQHEEKW